MISYKQEFIKDVKSECIPLIEKHWEEIALYQDTIKLSPDWDAYQQLEDSGNLKIFTARDESKLVGYYVVIVRSHIHYSDHLFAANDVIYLSKEYRSGNVAAKMIKFVEKCLKEDGVSVMIINSKTHAPFDILLKRLGFSHVENLFSKRI